MGIDEEGFLSSDLGPFRESIRKKYADHFRLVEQVNRFCQDQKFKIKINNADGRQVVAASVMIKIMNDVQGAVLLLERGLGSQGRSLLRVAAEGVIVLGNIVQSEAFYKTYVLTGEHERLRFIKAIKKRPEPDFAEAQRDITPELIKQLDDELRGVEERNVRQWAENIGIGHLYDVTYRLFSQDIHCDPRSLEPYLGFDKADDIVGLEWGPNVDSDIAAELLACVQLLLFCMTYIDRLFKLGINAALMAFKPEFDRLDSPERLELP